MLREFYNEARNLIDEYQPQIKQKTCSKTMLYIKASELTEELKTALVLNDYALAIQIEEDGFLQILQPSIPHIDGQYYGFIPEEVRSF